MTGHFVFGLLDSCEVHWCGSALPTTTPTLGDESISSHTMSDQSTVNTSNVPRTVLSTGKTKISKRETYNNKNNLKKIKNK